MKESYLENQYIEFNTTKPEITESVDDKDRWLNLKGVALVAGKSRNNRIYTDENLKENDGREFKYIWNHPKKGETMKSEQIVGKGILRYENGILRHEGKIRNTMTYPDVVSSVSDEFVDPSIGATFARVDESVEDGEKVYRFSGTEINHIALVAHPGVKSATIEVAMEECFNAHNIINEETDEEDNKNKINGDKVMEEETNFKQLYEELVAKQASDKVEKTNTIMEEMAARLKVLEEATKVEPVIETPIVEAVETGDAKVIIEEEEIVKPIIREDNEGVTMTTEAYNQFNKEIREVVGEPQK